MPAAGYECGQPGQVRVRFRVRVGLECPSLTLTLTLTLTPTLSLTLTLTRPLVELVPPAGEEQTVELQARYRGDIWEIMARPSSSRCTSGANPNPSPNPNPNPWP